MKDAGVVIVEIVLPEMLLIFQQYLIKFVPEHSNLAKKLINRHMTGPRAAID